MAPLVTFFLTVMLWSLLLPLLPSATEDFNNSKNSLASISGTGSGRCNMSSAFTVLVPNRPAFKQFVDCSDPNYVRGFSVDVFKSAWLIVRPEAPWKDVTIRCFDVQHPKTFDDLVQHLSGKDSVDAVVGDVTIGANRSKYATFTLPYVESGIRMLAPTVGRRNRFPGVFFAPFTAHVWVSICGFAVVTGYVLWLLEQSSHRELREGAVKQRIQKSLRFIVQLMVLFKRDTMTNLLAKAVWVGWIAFIVALGSTYIASFSAILTQRKIAPENLSIQNLPHETYPIGYPTGSIVFHYLKETLGISQNRLLNLTTTDDYLEALIKGPQKPGGVAVILDEVPYLNLFLSGLPASSCNYMTIGPKLTNAGFGLAFRNGLTNLSKAFSMAILNLSESGQLQMLQSGAKISDFQCPTEVQSTRLDLISSECVFFLLGLVLVACVMRFASMTLQRSQIVASIRNESGMESEADAVADASNVSNVNDMGETIYHSNRQSSSTSPRHLLRLETFP